MQKRIDSKGSAGDVQVIKSWEGGGSLFRGGGVSRSGPCCKRGFWYFEIAPVIGFQFVKGFFLEDREIGLRGPISLAEQLTTQQSNRSPMTRVQKNKLPSRGRPRNPPTPSKPRQSSRLVTQQSPKHLSRETKAWWKSIVDAYELEEHQFKILLVACEALDRREQARALLKKNGLTFTDDKGMIRQRPEVCIERDSSTAFLRALRALKLEGEAP